MMKNDLTCAVVRDLLPSYVEGLTSEETNEAVDAHLAQCPDCTAQKDAMTAPEAAEQAETAKEVDYLKTVKRRRWKWVIGAIFCTLALVAAGLAANTFAVGREATMENVYNFSRVDEDTQTFYLNIDTLSSGIAYWSWKTEEADGVVTVTARQGPVSFLHKEGWGRLQIPLDGVHEIYLFGQLVYQDGMVIQQNAVALYNARTPYLGNAPALSGITANLWLLQHQKYTISLQTSERPYGWTIAFSTDLEEGLRWNYDQYMLPCAPLMLALVDNLDQVSWTYMYGDEFRTQTVTLEEINTLLPKLTDLYNSKYDTNWTARDSVKDYADSIAGIQQLADLCDLMHSKLYILFPDIFW